MRESHACGLKTSISRIKDNFSRLTHKFGRVVLKKLHFISDLLCIISLLLTTIAKAFKCLQFVWIVSVQRSSEYRRTFSATFGSLREIVGNLRKWLGRFPKSRSWTRQKSHAFDSKKVGRYIMVNHTSRLFAQADLFSRSRVTAFYFRRHHWKLWKHCKLYASCN